MKWFVPLHNYKLNTGRLQNWNKNCISLYLGVIKLLRYNVSSQRFGEFVSNTGSANVS